MVDAACAHGADRIAIGCPFCRVMMTDGLTAEQSDGNAREEVEVVDVANMLLAAVNRANFSDSTATSRSLDQISSGSRSTQPGCGKCCLNSRWAIATTSPAPSKMMARDDVVP